MNIVSHLCFKAIFVPQWGGWRQLLSEADGKFSRELVTECCKLRKLQRKKFLDLLSNSRNWSKTQLTRCSCYQNNENSWKNRGCKGQHFEQRAICIHNGRESGLTHKNIIITLSLPMKKNHLFPQKSPESRFLLLPAVFHSWWLRLEEL